MMASTPRIDWFRKHIPDGKTVALVGEEDKAFWEGKATLFEERLTLSAYNIPRIFDYALIPEILHKKEEPVSFLKNSNRVASILLLSVPFEYGWDARWRPFTDKSFLRHYDVETLAKDVEAAGLTYTLELVEFGGWAFLCAECH